MPMREVLRASFSVTGTLYTYSGVRSDCEETSVNLAALLPDVAALDGLELEVASDIRVDEHLSSNVRLMVLKQYASYLDQQAIGHDELGDEINVPLATLNQVSRPISMQVIGRSP